MPPFSVPFFSKSSGSKAHSPASAKRGRLLLETLERRQLLAGDVELLATDASEDPAVTNDQVQQSSLEASSQAEGELVNDLVQFAKDLADAGVQFFGADWCPACTQQKELFQDGSQFLPFIEVTGPDRTLNQIGIDEGITEFPTWEFPDPNDPNNVIRRTGVIDLATLSTLSNVPIPQGETPSFAALGTQTVQIGSPLHIPVDAYDPDGGPLTITVSGDSDLVEATVLSGNRSIRIDMETYGDMVFELFEQRAPVASGRVIDLAQDGFYDGIVFHRIVNEFVIQAGDPTGTGTSGSTLGTFDDDFHPDLQHNRTGVLSFAKAGDDTNNSQFFVTEVPTRFLDFNHSVFGQLVEGDDAREAISNHETSSNGQPTTPIRIESVDVFDDTENAVIMLKPTGNGTGSATMTVTVRDQDGNEFTEQIQVDVVADTDDSQPFLNPVTVPASFANTAPAQIQLSSIDVEGDPVTYTATQQTATQDATVSIDADTGLLTVTPDSGFVGDVDVLVGVQRRVSDGSGDFDSQRITINFESSAVPSGLDLLASSDSGASDSDNITNAGSLTFSVDGVTDGATVEIINVDGGAVIGTGVASGETITITTTNIAALGDGSYQLAARQRVGGETSDISTPITLVYDTTAPDSVIASASTQANVDTLFETNLISAEEGSGLVYALTTQPGGSTIDASSGLITWTPTEQQLGSNTFSLSLTDAAGNTRNESFSVEVAGDPLASIKLQIVDANGNEITSVDVGDEFFLQLIGVDERGAFDRRGVFAAFADILFDSDLVRTVPGSSIDYDTRFPIQQNGIFSNGLIDELGAATDRLSPSNLEESLIATVRLEALASGSLNIRSEPADATSSEVLLYGNDNQIPATSVAYGSVSLAIGQTFTVGRDTFTVSEDSGGTTLDVLANDQVVVGTGTLSVVSVTQPASGGSVSLSNGVVSFTPAADFSGTSSFTYQVSDTNGVQDTGSVTVTVSPVNDPPSADDDVFNVDAGSSDNTLDVLANDTVAPDADETLSIDSVTTSTAGGTVSIASDLQSIVYQPPADFTGTDTFSYTVTDGSLQSTAQVSVTVVSPDNPPTAVDDSFNVTEDAAEATFDVLGNDTRDVDGQVFVLNNVGVPTGGGSARISADGFQFFYTPAPDFSGTDEVIYTIRDTGGGLASATVTFTVNAVNDPPPSDDFNVNVNRGSAESLLIEIVDLPDNVDSSETLTFTNVTNPTSGGSVRIESDSASILYTPPTSDFTGTDTVTYTVSDGSDLTSTGTITVTVADLSTRDFFFQIADGVPQLDGIRLIGSDSLGNSVDVPLSYDANGDALFDDVLPGDYAVEIPAIPFLLNAETPRTVPITSAPDDGDMTIESEIGRLRPEFISIRDWLGSSPTQSLLVAVQPGSAASLSLPSSAIDTVTDPQVELDSVGENLIIRGTNDTGANVEATVAAVNDARVQLRGQSGETRLLKIDVADAEMFTVVDDDPGSTPAPSTGEGEQAGSDVAAASLEIAPSPADSTSSLAVGDTAAEGESPAAGSVTLADVFVPNSSLGTETSSNVVLPLPSGDVWMESESIAGVADAPDANLLSVGNSSQNAAISADSSDQAMQDVAPGLSLIASGADSVAESIENSGIDHAAVDAALSSELL